MASVVIIEDEQRIRELVARVLADRGHDVESTATAMEGLQAVVRVSPELVILDMGLPDLDGTELAHVPERAEPFRRGLVSKPRDRVLEHPPVVLVDRDWP